MDIIRSLLPPTNLYVPAMNLLTMHTYTSAMLPSPLMHCTSLGKKKNTGQIVLVASQSPDGNEASHITKWHNPSRILFLKCDQFLFNKRETTASALATYEEHSRMEKCFTQDVAQTTCARTRAKNTVQAYGVLHEKTRQPQTITHNHTTYENEYT